MGWVHSTHTNFWHDKHARSRREIIENMASDGTDRIADILRELAVFVAGTVQAKRHKQRDPLDLEQKSIAHWESVQRILERAADEIDE